MYLVGLLYCIYVLLCNRRTKDASMILFDTKNVLLLQIIHSPDWCDYCQWYVTTTVWCRLVDAEFRGEVEECCCEGWTVSETAVYRRLQAYPSNNHMVCLSVCPSIIIIYEFNSVINNLVECLYPIGGLKLEQGVFDFLRGAIFREHCKMSKVK